MAARKLTVYNDVRKDLAVFEEEYSSIVIDCTTTAGMKSAKDCRKEIRDARSNLEDLRKEAKAPVLAKGTQIDDEAKAIKEKLDALFMRFDGEIKAIENKKEIDAAAAVKAAEDKVNELEAREQAIIAKEIELGLRDAPELQAGDDSDEQADEGKADGDNSDSGDVDSEPTTSAASSAGDNPADIETICEPHIKKAGERLKVLKAIRKLVEPTDAQPDGKIDDSIAENHDAVLADIWELVDVFKQRG